MIEAILADRRARFILVGGAATLAHAVMLLIFVELGGLNPTLANLFAFICAFFVSYLGHKRFTFRSDASHASALPGFLLAALAGLVVNVGLFAVLSDVFRVHYWLVFGLVILLAPSVVYVISRDHAFQSGEESSARGGFAGWDKKHFIIPALLFGATVIYAVTYYYPVFYFDHWDLLPMIIAADEERLGAGQVFALHGSHWHATGYIIMLALGKFTGHAHLADVMANLVMALIAFGGVAVLVRRQVQAFSPRASLFVPVAILALFVFSLDQSQNWLWGWQTAVFGHLIGVVWCLEALTRHDLRLRGILFACITAAMAIYGFATGWALLPIGFAVLLLRRITRRDQGWVNLAIWTGFTALMLWHFKLALAARGGAELVAASSLPGFSEPVYMYAIYAMNYVANAVTRFSPDIALPVFLISGGVALWCLFSLSRKDDFSFANVTPALALMAYGIGAGLLTSLGRLDEFGPDTAFLGRYITFANLYWVGLISLVFAARAHVGKNGWRGIAYYLKLLVAMKLGAIGNVVSSAVPHATEVREASTALQACYPNVPDYELEMFFAPTQMRRARSHLDYLKERRLSVFASVGPGDTCGADDEGAPQHD